MAVVETLLKNTTAEEIAFFYSMEFLLTAVASFPHYHVCQLGASEVIPANKGVNM